MIVRIISIGKIKSRFVRDGEAEYIKRLTGSGTRIERVEVDAESVSNKNVAQAQAKEAQRLLARIAPDDFLVVLDVKARQMDSEELAQWMRQRIDSGVRTMVWAIGGAYGWHPDIFARANLRLSLSELTFPYQLTRLILVEQLYRAHTINQGTPYHKA